MTMINKIEFAILSKDNFTIVKFADDINDKKNFKFNWFL